jgi:2-polyprenyl-6-methoxyphenol hydroxylase-like FAD-dependent oxidoreductase
VSSGSGGSSRPGAVTDEEEKEVQSEETPVLIVGGSVVGLATALFLAWQGLPSVLVERHRGTSIHPRAMGLSPRSMELLRTVGLEDEVRRADPIRVENSGILRVDTLAGEELGWVPTPTPDDISEISPAPWAFSAQDRVEPVLRQRAEELGADLRFGVELVSFEPGPDAVTALVRNRESGDERTIRARWLVAADGSRSPIRRRLGIPMRGPGTLANAMSILFHADLSAALRGRHFAVCYIESPEAQGVLAAYDNDRWALGVGYTPQAGQSANDFTPERCRHLVRKALGTSDLDPEILAILPWELAADVATRFQVGPVLLAGDSAHVNPPAGAFGANTGIQDAHNLAWKLVAVAGGTAGAGLLDSYDVERRPVAAATVDQALMRQAFRGDGAADPPGLVDDLAVMLGYSYHSDAVLAEAGQVTPLFQHPRQWTGEPGSRAPHVVLERDGRRLSSLDLYGRRFVLLTDAAGGDWCRAAERVSAQLGIELDLHRVGVELTDVGRRWHDVHGLGSGGAVLVRPDGFVATRSHPAAPDAASVLEHALTRLLGRGVVVRGGQRS